MRAEVAAGAAALGLTGFEMLGYPDGELTDGPELRGAIVGAIRRLRPDAVVCPDPTAAFFGRTYVNHRDHRVVGWATLDAVAPAAWSPLYFPDAGAPHHVAEVYLSGLARARRVRRRRGCARTPRRRRCAATRRSCADSSELLDSAFRRRAAEVGRSVGVRYAEGFRLLTPS